MITYTIGKGDIAYNDTVFRFDNSFKFRKGDIVYIEGNAATRPELLTSILAGATQLRSHEKFSGVSMRGELVKVTGTSNIQIKHNDDILLDLQTSFETGSSQYEAYVHQRSKLIGYVFGEPRQYIIGSTVEEECRFSYAAIGKKLTHLPDVLSRYGLDGKEGYRTEKLSGGESHRLNFACVLEADTPIVICDLSAANLDQDFLKFLCDNLDATRHDHIVFIYNGGRPDFLNIANYGLSIEQDRASGTYHVSRNNAAILSRKIFSRKDIQLAPMVRDTCPVLVAKRVEYNAMIRHPFNVTLYSGEKIILSGTNGAGKTTLARIFSEQLQPTKGTLTFFPKTLSKIMTFQYTTSFPADWTLHRILLKKELILLKEEHDRDWEKYMDIPYCDLPEGIKKYAYVQYMLRIPADLYLLDEPFAGMDYEEQQKIAILINNSNASFIIFNHEKHIAGLKKIIV